MVLKSLILYINDVMGFTIFRKYIKTAFKNIFDFTTACDWDCVAAVERLPALHYSVDFILLSSGIMGFIVKL